MIATVTVTTTASTSPAATAITTARGGRIARIPRTNLGAAGTGMGSSTEAKVSGPGVLPVRASAPEADADASADADFEDRRSLRAARKACAASRPIGMASRRVGRLSLTAALGTAMGGTARARAEGRGDGVVSGVMRGSDPVGRRTGKLGWLLVSTAQPRGSTKSPSEPPAADSSSGDSGRAPGSSKSTEVNLLISS